MKAINFRKNGLVFNFQFDTSNSKTGSMVQNYILPESWILSSENIENLSDKEICFDCTHGQSKEKTCYVRSKMSNLGLISKVRSFRKLGLENIPEFSEKIEAKLLGKINGKAVRFGAYGEPILLGEDLVQKITKKAKFWTGYTHQWHKNNWAKNYFMASVETERLAEASHKLGFRSFFVGQTENKNFVTCPASKEAGRKTTCENCKLCMGTQSKAKSVTILPH